MKLSSVIEFSFLEVTYQRNYFPLDTLFVFPYFNFIIFKKRKKYRFIFVYEYFFIIFRIHGAR